RRTLRLVSAEEDRRSVRGSAEPLPHEARSRLHPAGGSVSSAFSVRSLRLQTRLIIIAGLVLILVGAAIGAASWISVRPSLMSDLDAQLENMTRHARADGGPNQGPGGAGDQTPVDDALLPVPARSRRRRPRRGRLRRTGGGAHRRGGSGPTADPFRPCCVD